MNKNERAKSTELLRIYMLPKCLLSAVCLKM